MNATQTNKTNTSRNLVIFAIVVLASGWAGCLLSKQLNLPQENPGMLLWLVAPLLAVLVLRTFAGDSWRDAGLRPLFLGNVKWYILSLLVYPVLTLTIVGMGSMFSWITLQGFSVSVFLQAFALALLPAFLKNILEEFAWRGYLTPKLATLNLSDYSLYLIVGLIWGLWHVPYYLYFLDATAMRSFATINSGLFIPLAIVAMLAWSIMFAEFRFLTGSVWPAVLLHMMLDAFVNSLILDDSFSIATGKEIWVHPVVGLFSIISYTIVGLTLRSIRLSRKTPQLVQSAAPTPLTTA
ncbi:MAG TPA: CPBP family intramembrane glutamic endopeptidase [Pontibacter sp.]